MNYTRPSFTQPVSGGKISQTAYEVAVGLRCARCLGLMTARHSCPVSIDSHPSYKGTTALNIDPATGKPPTITARGDFAPVSQEPK